MAIPIIVGIGIRVGIWAAGRIAARQAAKAATQAAVRTATSTAGRQALSAANGLEAAIQTAEMAQKLIEESDEKTGNQDITCPTGQCDESAEKEQEEKLKELEEESTLTDDRGNLKNFEKEGTWKDANDDFDSLNIPPEKQDTFSTRWGDGRSGQLENGGTIGVRPGSSSTNGPTLQYNPPSGPTIKWRYK